MRKIPTSLFRLDTLKRPVHAGSLLVTEPFLSESFFNHAVITLVDYSEREGAMGVVMNNPSGSTLGELIDGVDRGCSVPVYCGGPVGLDRLFFIHTLGTDVIGGAREYAPGLFAGGNFDDVTRYVEAGYPVEGFLRFFVGYSGWSRGQLEEELDNNVWAVADCPSDRSELFTDSGDSYWHRAVRRLGGHYRAWQMMPRDVSSN